MINTETSFIAACKDFFGMKHAQTLTEFRDEVAALTPKDRAEIRQGLIANGYKIKDA